MGVSELGFATFGSVWAPMRPAKKGPARAAAGVGPLQAAAAPIGRQPDWQQKAGPSVMNQTDHEEIRRGVDKPAISFARAPTDSLVR